MIYIFLFVEKKVWTVLAHNNTTPIKVQNSSPLKPHVMKFSYNASAEQLRAIITRSDQCQQEVVYNCRKSRLFNTKGELILINVTIVLYFVYILFMLVLFPRQKHTRVLL